MTPEALQSARIDCNAFDNFGDGGVYAPSVQFSSVQCISHYVHSRVAFHDCASMGEGRHKIEVWAM